MKAIIVKPNEEYKVVEIGEELKDLQSIVGGYIEVTYLCKIFNKNNIIMICNDEGKLESLEPSILFLSKQDNSNVIEYLAGNIIICGDKYDDEGEKVFCSLSDEQIEVVKNTLKSCYISTDIAGSIKECYSISI